MAAATGPSGRARAASGPSVIVIGAGMAGLGAARALPPSTSTRTRRVLAGTDWDGRIGFAGEAALTNHPSTVHGALTSGLSIAKEILA